MDIRNITSLTSLAEVMQHESNTKSKCLPILAFYLCSRDEMYRQKYLFQSILRPDSCLSCLLPPQDKEILSRLCDARRLPTTACRTKKVPVVHKLYLVKLPVKSVQHPIFCALCIVVPFIDSLYSPYFSTVCAL